MAKSTYSFSELSKDAQINAVKELSEKYIPDQDMHEILYEMEEIKKIYLQCSDELLRAAIIKEYATKKNIRFTVDGNVSLMEE